MKTNQHGRAALGTGLIFLVSLFLMSSCCGCERQRPFRRQRGARNKTQQSKTKEIYCSGVSRTYHVHIPPSYTQSTPLPLVFVLHGGGGTGIGMERLTHMDEVADSGGFIVVYPEGIDNQWNDGRPTINPEVDDVGFFEKMLEKLESDYSVDEKRVYSTGISNGGFMSLRLAFDLNDRIAAIAVVGASMTEQLYRRHAPSIPVSVLLLHGTDDPLCPWSGGKIGSNRSNLASDRGNCVGAAETISYWVGANGCGTKPIVKKLPDADPRDGTRVREELYSGGKAGTEVELLAVEGGGHTWPGGIQYLPKLIIGRTSRDIDASNLIWEFFARHSIE
ncbi:MAG: PHB depolymerase family esterase [Actinomycetota bacterium]|nr:PHB depolymerase family esterase [Actinomycetota bacterium]